MFRVDPNSGVYSMSDSLMFMASETESTTIPICSLPVTESVSTNTMQARSKNPNSNPGSGPGQALAERGIRPGVPGWTRSMYRLITGSS